MVMVVSSIGTIGARGYDGAGQIGMPESIGGFLVGSSEPPEISGVSSLFTGFIGTPCVVWTASRESRLGREGIVGSGAHRGID
jgi:hypothetical protein